MSVRQNEHSNGVSVLLSWEPPVLEDIDNKLLGYIVRIRKGGSASFQTYANTVTIN